MLLKTFINHYGCDPVLKGSEIVEIQIPDYEPMIFTLNKLKQQFSYIEKSYEKLCVKRFYFSIKTNECIIQCYPTKLKGKQFSKAKNRII